MSLEARLRTHVEALVGERHPIFSPAALLRAERYLHDQFQRLGLTVTPHAFQAFHSTYRNIIGTRPPTSTGNGPDLPGDVRPLIVAAHYDTVIGSPGADDNASGVAVMLEAARLLSGIQLRTEVRFIGFGLEEENLCGSLAYVTFLNAHRQKIRGALVLECVGYRHTAEGSQLRPQGIPIAVPTTGDFLAIVGNSDSIELMTAIEKAVKAGGADLKTVSLTVPGQGEHLPDTRRSDHAAFWAYGYPAVMLTDTANFRNPHYHQPTDTIETLDFSFMRQVTEALVVAITALAGGATP